MNIKSKFTKKNLVIVLIILLAVLAVSIFLYTKDGSENTDNQSSNENSAEAPEAIDEPAPEGLEEPPAPTPDTELPEGTVSPHTVASDPNEYLGKEISLRGMIVESGDGQYSIVGQKAEEELGIRLDFSKTDLDPGQNHSPVTVTGKLKTPDGSTPLTLEVISVQE